MPLDSAVVRKVPTGPARKGPQGMEPSRITAGQPGTEKAPVQRRGHKARIDARGIYYKTLNEQIREQIEAGLTHVVLDHVNGQRYIGAGLKAPGVTIEINGVPGNDLATFMDGATVLVNENAQDGVANTMNSGLVVIDGDAGDVLGYGMRGGSLYVRGNVGYRVGIHMKAYQDRRAAVVVGGRARDFFGEYLAGGELVVLGLDSSPSPILGSYVGTGMHGGVIYVRGEVSPRQVGREVGIAEPDEVDQERIRDLVGDFCAVMDLDADAVLARPFVKLYPHSHRPYGKLYAS